VNYKILYNKSDDHFKSLNDNIFRELIYYICGIRRQTVTLVFCLHRRFVCMFAVIYVHAGG